VPPEEPIDPTLPSNANENPLAPTEVMGAGETPGLLIGRYHLLQKVGEGGMGEVWLAEQTEPVRRRVALKLVKAGMNTREVIARFESERQALALMDHPAIAKVFDAGSTPQGAPYFVMEYVAGVPITAYCDKHRLSTRDRLELFMHVCEGVQHAHQKAIIHRDLKPSNILVTEVDGHPAPKIIDFGVAKALTQKLSADTMFTRLGALVGTPEYMSPEQASSSGEDIDTRTDVYSLGIIFYELLAGVHPIELRKVAFEEFLRRLREDDPPKLSTKIRGQDPATSTELARKRQTEPPALVKQMRGDLDSIALKALEKDRARRYGSPSDFALDIARYLKNEPVLAVPPSVAYRTRKFARRYRVALVTTCAFALVLIAAAVISIRQSIRANKEAAVAQAVNDFLQNDMLAQASAANQSGPSAKPDPDLKVRTALDRAAQRITGKFDQQPEVEAAIRDTIGQTYIDLGLYPEARKQIERALELQRRVLGAGNPATLKTISHLERVAYFQGKYAEAEALDSQNLEIRRRVLGPEHPDTLDSINALATAYYAEGKYPQAEALFGRTLDIQRRVLGPEHRDTLKSMNNLALVYRGEAKYTQATALDKQTVEIVRRMLGPEHPRTITSMNNLANDYRDQGKYAQAEALYSQTLEISRRVLGPEHPDTLMLTSNLAGAYEAESKYAQAEALASQALEMRRRVLGPEHPDTLRSMNRLAGIYNEQGKYAQAEALHSQTLEIRRRVLGPEHPDTLYSMNNLGDVYQAEGKYGQAEALYIKTLEARRRVLSPEHSDTLDSMTSLGDLYQAEGKFPQAEALYSKALEIGRRVLGPEHPGTWGSMIRLGNVYEAEGKYGPAEALYSPALELSRRVFGPEHENTLIAMSNLAVVDEDLGKHPEAEALFGHARVASRRVLGPEESTTLSILSGIAFMNQRRGKFEPAETYAAEVLEGRRHSLGPEYPDTMDAAADLALAYQSEMKFTKSEPLARQALELDRNKRPDHWQRFRAEALLGASLAGQKKYAEAEPLLLEGYRGMVARKDRMAVRDSYHLDRAREWIVQLYRAWGKPAKAAEWDQVHRP
jgi:serine/threonine protein kinase/tetratricopeptide (TPR) repeat protein